MLKKQDGVASVEMVPILMLFALLFNFTLGFFGIIHTGILNSIAARNYAYETFRQRVNLTYLRDIEGSSAAAEVNNRYTINHFRFHGIISGTGAGANAEDWYVTQRPMKFTDLSALQSEGTSSDHLTLVRTIQSTGKVSDIFTGKTAGDGKNGVDPVWVQTIYGICLNAICNNKN